MTNFTWNGTTSSGAAAPAGVYTVGRQRCPSAPPPSPSVLLIQSTVSSVTIDPTSQALDLNTNNGTVPLSSVVSVL